MGLQQVKSEILDDAREKADQIISDAEEEADEIISEAEEEAEEIHEKYEGQLEEEKDTYEKKTVSNARMKAKQIKLSAKEEKINQVFDQFENSLEKLSEEEKQNYLDRCLEKVNFEPGKVIGSEEFEKFVDTDFEQKDIEGVIIVSDDGEKRQNFTYGKIKQRFKDSYRGKIAEKLFSG